MSNSGFLSGKDDSAVENLLSQAKDLYVLEQVAAINCSGFTDYALPTNLEARFRRLKSLPVSRTDPVSSSKKLLSHSKSMASHGNAFSAPAFSGDEKRSFSGIKRVPSVKSRPLVSSVEETRIVSEIKRDPSMKSRPLVSSAEETRTFSGIKRDPPSVNSNFEKNSRGVIVSETGMNFSDSGRIRSNSSRFSREGKFSPPTTQTMKFLPKEKPIISSSSFTSTGLASPSSNLDLEERSNQKSRSKLSSMSWFDKLSLSRAMGCLCPSLSKSSSNSKKTLKSNNDSSDSGGKLTSEERLEKAKIDSKETQRMCRKARKLVRKSKALRGPCWFLVC